MCYWELSRGHEKDREPRVMTGGGGETLVPKWKGRVLGTRERTERVGQRIVTEGRQLSWGPKRDCHAVTDESLRAQI